MQSRNIYEEFFELPHKCYPNQERVLTFPWLPTIKEFLDAVSQRLLSNTTTTTQENEDWLYKIVSQDSFSCPVVRSK